jgi:hypothetical protein
MRSSVYNEGIIFKHIKWETNEENEWLSKIALALI